MESLKRGRECRGIISIFLVIILISMMIFSCVIIDGTRIISGQEMVEGAVQNTVHSILGGYDSVLKEKYGLFGFSSGDAEDEEKEKIDQKLEERKDKYLSNNLNIQETEGSEEGFDLYGFNVESSKLILRDNYASPYVTEKYILENMKYRGPVALLSFVAKLNKMEEEVKEMEKEAEVIKVDLDLKKAINTLFQQLEEFIKLKDEEEKRYKNIKEMAMGIYLNEYVPNCGKEKMWDELERILKSKLDDDFIDKETESEYKNILRKCKNRNNFLRNQIEDNKRIMEEKPRVKGDAEKYIRVLKGELDDQKECYDKIETTALKMQNSIYNIEIAYDNLQEKCDVLKEGEFKEYIKETLTKTENAILKGIDIKKIAGEIINDQVPENKKSIKAFKIASEEMGEPIEIIRDWNGKIDKDYLQEMYSIVRKDIFSFEDEEEVFLKVLKKDRKEYALYKKYLENKGEYLWKFKNFKLDLAQNTRDKIEESHRIIGEYFNAVDGEKIEGKDDEVKGLGDGVEKEILEMFNSPKKSIDNKSYKYRISANIVEVEKERDDKKDNDKFEYSEGGADKELENLDLLTKILDASGRMAGELANKVYVNEYAMMNFTNWMHFVEKDPLHFKRGIGEEKVLDYELEYILNGLRSDLGNISAMKGKLFLVRFLPNLMHIMMDSTKRWICLQIAVATGATVLAPIVQFVIMAIWATYESMDDVKGLLEGEKIPLIKDKNSWRTNILSKAKPKNKKSGILPLGYTDYLRLFLICQSKKKTLYRIEDLIQFNMQEFTGNSGYRLSKIHPGVEIEAEVSMKYIFMTGGIIPKDMKVEGKHKLKKVNIYEGY